MDGARLDPELTLAELTRMMPSATSVLEEAGVDYGCHGATSFADAAEEAGFRADDLRRMLRRAPQAELRNWWRQPLPDLIRFLIADHAALTSEVFPAMRAAILSVVPEDDADRHLVSRIGRIFTHFISGSTGHIFDEEREIFPTIEALLSVAANGGPLPPSISQRVLGELIEHRTLSERLRTMRELAMRTRGEGTTELLHTLALMTRGVHYHIHLENNVLYPRAIEMENTLRRNA
jgi:regulator of cell morphogenesis and NO signaling